MNVAAFMVLLVTTLGLSLAFGGGPERWTAGMFAAAALASHLLYNGATDRYQSVEYAVAAVDLLLLAGLAGILVKADRFWPIVMFAAHGVTVLAHAVKLIDQTIVRQAYAVSIASPAYLTLVILLTGVARHQRRLRRHGEDLDWSDLRKPT